MIGEIAMQEFSKSMESGLMEMAKNMDLNTNVADLDKPVVDDINTQAEIKSEGLTEEEKTKIKEETGWSDEIIENIKNMDQYEVLKNAGLIEAEINGRKCLIKENLDLDTPIKDAYGRIKTNRDRIADGNAPIDIKTGKPLQLHHLGQKIDSPLVELTEEEHRTGEYKDGKKNQSLWHDNVVETEVHGKGNTWATVRGDHWTERVKQLDGESKTIRRRE